MLELCLQLNIKFKDFEKQQQKSILDLVRLLSSSKKMTEKKFFLYFFSIPFTRTPVRQIVPDTFKYLIERPYNILNEGVKHHSFN